MEDTSHNLSNPRVAHEQSDADTRKITEFGIGLGFIVIVAAFVMWFLFDRLAEHEAVVSQKPEIMAPKRPQPPEPRLQTTPRVDLREFRASEEKRLTAYGWVDPAKGIATIPVDKALDIMARKGFPVRSAERPSTSQRPSK